MLVCVYVCVYVCVCVCMSVCMLLCISACMSVEVRGVKGIERVSELLSGRADLDHCFRQ